MKNLFVVDNSDGQTHPVAARSRCGVFMTMIRSRAAIDMKPSLGAMQIVRCAHITMIHTGLGIMVRVMQTMGYSRRKQNQGYRKSEAGQAFGSFEKDQTPSHAHSMKAKGASVNPSSWGKVGNFFVIPDQCGQGRSRRCNNNTRSANVCGNEASYCDPNANRADNNQTKRPERIDVEP